MKVKEYNKVDNKDNTKDNYKRLTYRLGIINNCKGGSITSNPRH